MGVPKTHSILPMLFTHTTSGLPVLCVAAVRPSSFQVGVLVPDDFSVSSLPLRGQFLNWTSLCFLFCCICMRNRLRFTDSNIVTQTVNKQERAFSGVTLACLKIRWRNEEAINSTRNRIYSLKYFYFLLYRRPYFLLFSELI